VLIEHVSFFTSVSQTLTYEVTVVVAEEGMTTVETTDVNVVETVASTVVG